MLGLCEQLRALARETNVHIQGLAHCKKLQPEDPFDGFLGSTALRGETDTNIALYRSRGKQLLQSETRMGSPWEPIELNAELGSIGKSQMVTRFVLGSTLAQTNDEASAAQEQNTRRLLKSRIVASLREHGGEAKMSDCFDSITGQRQLKFDVRDELIREKVITMLGVPHSSSNPLRFKLIKPDWTGLVINPSSTPPIEPPTEYVTCADGDCTNQVSAKGERCYRHKIERKEVSCVN